VSKGYGFHQPLVPNSSDANRALNRRVQFIRTESGGPAPPL
jgi:OOP family OmpA-OmpF porin